MKRKLIFITAALLAITMVFAGCSNAPATTSNQPSQAAPSQAASQSQAAASQPAQSQAASSSVSGKKISIGISFDNINDPYWSADIKGMQKAADELGVTLNQQNAQGDPTVQNQQIETLITKGVNAIVCTPNDAKAILQAVQKCNDAKIPFIWNDRQVVGTNDAKVTYGVGTDNYTLAKNGADWLAQKAKTDGVKLKVLILDGDLTDPNAVARTKAFNDSIKANSDVMTLANESPAGWDEQKTLNAAVNSLQADPDINCILLPADLQLPPVLNALEQFNKKIAAGQKGHVYIGALNGSAVALDDVKAGFCDVVICQPILDTGYSTVKAAVDAVNGVTLDPNGKMNPGFLVYKDNFDQASVNAYGYATK